ncbi:GNAT family N-acetyltransferase [Paenibacillus sp. P3E]
MTGASSGRSGAAVREEYHRKGIGKELVNVLIRQLGRRQCCCYLPRTR